MSTQFWRLMLVLASLMLLASCGGGGSGGSTSSGAQDWYYHWNCNGDPECLGSNPELHGSGNYDAGPNESSCTALLNYAQSAWGPNATNICDQLPTGASSPRGKMHLSSLVETAGATGAVIYVAGDNIPSSQITVTINGVWADIIALNNTQIGFQVPHMANFTGPVVVTAPGEVVKVTPAFTVINRFNAVSADGPRYVVVGNGGTLISSVDAVHWTQADLGTDGDLVGVAYSGSNYVAMGGAIFASGDGRIWSSSAPAMDFDFFGLTSSGSLFVAVGQGGLIETSTTGASWTHLSVCNCVSLNLYGVTWSPALAEFLAVGTHGAVFISPDGATWTSEPELGKTLNGVIWTGTEYVAVGETGSTFTSPDGVTWTKNSTKTSDFLYGIAWSGSMFVAVGYNGVIFSSPDANTWTARSSNTGNPLYAVAWSAAGGQFIAVGDSSMILTSPDGVSWTQRTPP